MIVGEILDRCNTEVQMVNKDDDVDLLYGWSGYQITLEQLEELRNSKYIYVEDGEYATIIRIKE